MGFTATPTDGSSTPIPMSSAVPDGTNTPLATEGGPAKTTGGNQLVPVATYQYDGYNVVEGATTDAAVTGDNSGTLSAKLRGLTKIFTDIWDSVNHRIKVDGSGVTQPVSGTFWQATQPVSGTITANAGSGTFTNQQSNVQADYDTSAGTQNVTMQGIALPASGGAAPGGTSTNPIRTDPTGTTVQPVSGTVTANAGTNLNTSLLALESGGNLASAKTDLDNISTVSGGTTDAAVVGDNTGSISAKLRGLTKILNDIWDSVNHRIKVDGSGVTQPVSGTISITANSAVNVAQVAGTATDTNSGNKSAGTQRVVLATDQPAVPVAMFNGSVNQAWNAVDNVGDNSHAGIGVIAQSAYNGNPNYTYDRLRIANVFKTATATATGDTALWTPTTGTKFRIMAYAVYVTQNAAISGGGLLEILLRDATTSLGLGFSVYCPSAAGTTFGAGASSGWALLGNGKLSATINNALNVNLSATLTAGEVRIVAIGMEE